MTRAQIDTRTYATKQSAVRAMWSYVRSLQRDGVHTGALSGDGGTVAQWIGNDGRTYRAGVDHNNAHHSGDRRWYVVL